MRRLVVCLLAVFFLSLGCTSRENSSLSSITPEPAQQINLPAPVPRNENGQAYGSGLYATEEPDLIKAYGVDGTLGYVRSVDLNGAMPKTPEEALAQQPSRADRVRQIPLYAMDGKTVIGVFNVYSGQAR